MFIGNVSTGKTVLKKRIIGATNKEKNKKAIRTISIKNKIQPTKGVVITRWEDTESKSLFSLWDFSGHEEYHVAHSFFFSSGSVYILLFDCSLPLNKLVQDNKLLYWFHFLQTQAGRDASVILIGTKLDLLQKEFWFFDRDLKTKERLQEISIGNIFQIFFFFIIKKR